MLYLMPPACCLTHLMPSQVPVAMKMAVHALLPLTINPTEETIMGIEHTGASLKFQISMSGHANNATQV